MRVSMLAACAAVISLSTAVPALADGSDPAVRAEGKKIAFNRTKGNCLACHMIEDGELPGNAGPPLSPCSSGFPTNANCASRSGTPPYAIRNP